MKKIEMKLNMMKNSFSLLVFATVLSVNVFAQESVVFDWAKRIGGQGYDYSNAMAVSISGNVYTTGQFVGNVDFDPGMMTYYLNDSGAYVSKLDASGNFIWAKRFGGEYTYGVNIAIDAAENVYTTGYFDDTVDFDPGQDTFYLSNANSFLSKLDSSGNFIWAFGLPAGCKVATDIVNNVFLAGHFTGTVDVNPGIDTFNVTGDGAFICKLDASGNFLWAKQLNSNNISVATIVTDNDGNIFVAGWHENTDFDPGLNNYTLPAGFFVLKLNASGNFVWAKIFTDIDVYNAYGGIALDNSGNIFATAQFNGVSDFDPSPGSVYNLTGNGGFFICKLDSSGNFLWAKQIDGHNNNAKSIKSDLSGNCYFAGSYMGTTDFDPGNGVYSMTSSNNSLDIYVAALDLNGNFLWAKGMKGTQSDGANAIALDDSHNIYISGIFRSTVDFNPDTTITYNLISAGYLDIFIQKFHQSCIVFQNEQICLVTVDTMTSKNKILWNKTYGMGTDYYIVYKEVAANIYDSIGIVSFNNPGSFIDLSSVPESHADKYKIAVVDTCGNVSGESFFHKTICLVISLYGNTAGLSWNHYEDESGVFIPSKYYIYRGTQANNLQLHDSISGSFTSYNDNNINYQYYYMVAVKRDGCDNDLKSNFSYSFSNKRFLELGINDNLNNEKLNIYPNPVANELIIEANSLPENSICEIFNSTGQMIYKSILNDKNKISAKIFQSGIYTIKINTGKSFLLKKFVKE